MHIDEDEISEDEQDSKEVSSQERSEIAALKQSLLEAEAKVKLEQNKARIAQKKLLHVEKVASQKVVESMPGASFDEESNHLAMLLATVLEKDDFSYNKETDKVEPKESVDFLKIIKDNCGDIKNSKEKLEVIENKVLEKLKRTLNRERSFSSAGSVCSRSSSRTRQRSDGDDAGASQQVAKQSKTMSRLPALKTL